MTIRLVLGLALAAVAATPAAAALDLSRYSVVLERGIDFDEASGVAFNYDKNTLFVIDDEGDDAAEFSLTGTKLTNDKFQQNYRDLEGVTYIGDGRYVLADERTEVMALIKPESQTTAPSGLPRTIYTGTTNAQKYAVNGGTNVGNNGLEGVAYDPITGGFWGVKQGGLQGTTQIEQKVYLAQVQFGNPTTGTTSLPFDPAPLGLGTLSDIAVLAANADPAASYYRNLLILSADASTRRLLEVSRTGRLISSFDLSGLAIQTIEGVVFGRDGRIYLVGETGGVTPGDASTSGLVVLAPPVPEPATWGMMLLGFGLVGAGLRRRTPAAA